MTLLEVLLALGLTGVVMVVISMAIHLHLITVDTRRADIEQAQVARGVLQHIAADIRNTVWYEPLDMSSLTDMSAVPGRSGDSGSSASSSGQESAGGQEQQGQSEQQSADRPLDIARQRYARGEIDRLERVPVRSIVYRDYRDVAPLLLGAAAALLVLAGLLSTTLAFRLP